MNEQEPARRVRSRKTSSGWMVELDNQSWADPIVALGDAIDACEQNGRPAERARAARLRALRNELSKG